LGVRDYGFFVITILYDENGLKNGASAEKTEVSGGSLTLAVTPRSTEKTLTRSLLLDLEPSIYKRGPSVAEYLSARSAKEVQCSTSEESSQ